MRVLMILGVASVSACASFPPPTETLANSMASVRGAEEVGAADVPQAALSLQLAQEEVQKAKKLMNDGQNEQAHFMALRAINDAELANALARENAARAAAQKAQAEALAAATPTP